MGLLPVGEPLSWEEAKKHSVQARRRGIEQFIKLYTCFKTRNDDPFKFGDEIEFSLVKFDHKQKRVFLLLKAEHLIKQLQNVNGLNAAASPDLACEWSPEFANYMLEAMPAQPYESDLSCILKIEANMRARRQQVQCFLDPNDEAVMSFSTFPLLGSPDFLWPRSFPTPGIGITTSLFFPDNAVFQANNPRYAMSVSHIRLRRKVPRGSYIPIYRDKNTPRPFHDDLSGYDCQTREIERGKLDHIYLEDIGAACSCLQVTFQAANLNEARFLYDQLIPFAPIVLAMTASSPIWRGYLTDIDVRWKVISELLDDRTPEELGEVPLKNDRYRLPKSRYGSVDCYLSESSAIYNDLPVVKDDEFYSQLINNGVDHLMAEHVAHLFTRDPLILYRESLSSSSGTSLNEDKSPPKTELFENIQASNWQSLRFKPPPVCVETCATGWRVEFRTAELQLTDFENAAFVSFLCLLTRAIIAYKDQGIDFRVPMSLVDENMRRAQKRDACMKEKFHFRSIDGSTSEMSINEIINGSDIFPGIISIIKSYLSQVAAKNSLDFKTSRKINQYLTLIGDKANGKVKTTASLMRSFVLSHPKYNSDSVVNNEIAYDLMWQLNEISNSNQLN